jgi:hypothetical protein
MDNRLVADVRQDHMAARCAEKRDASENGSEQEQGSVPIFRFGKMGTDPLQREQAATQHRLDNEANPAPLLANTARA